MIADGKKIAADIYAELKTEIELKKLDPHLAVITCAPNFETRKYLALKQKKAASVGIKTSIFELPDEATTDEIIARINETVAEANGIIVQLPLPSHVDTSRVLEALPVSHDIDALNPATTTFLPPVIGALKEILETYKVVVSGKHVVILGSGRLVGQPAAKWFADEGAHISIVTKDTEDIGYYTRQADIIVCGAGDPGFLKPDMIKEGVVILDAGTSEEGGVLKGDADPKCSDKASLFTPVPGGVGPLTVAVLLRSVVSVSRGRKGLKLL